jgi:diguanylate cyclase (GGDEF)-like protein
LLDRLQQAVTACERHKRYGAVLYLDMDNFKVLNDSKGHTQGDRLLVEVAARLQNALHEGDTVARVGGDEFVVILNDLGSEAEPSVAQAESVGEKLLQASRRPFDLQDHEYYGSSSIGVCLFAGGEPAVEEELLQRADTAMSQAKKEGRNNIRFYDPDMQAILESRLRLESWMRNMLPDQLILYFQAKVSDKRIFGAEALLRWRHPQQGMISPAEFIPLAEENGLILQIGEWVLQAACKQLKLWENDPETSSLHLSVNVSARQMHQPDFVAQVQGILTHTGADPAKLNLELTESMLVEKVEDVIAKMSALKAIGVSFALDDFGTGYSSLSYLKRLPLDELKIDQSFVRDILIDPNDAAIACTIIALGKSLGLSVIAEGVECQEQLDFLTLHGCHHFQGYMFSRPVPLEEFERLLHPAA